MSAGRLSWAVPAAALRVLREIVHDESLHVAGTNVADGERTRQTRLRKIRRSRPWPMYLSKIVGREFRPGWPGISGCEPISKMLPVGNPDTGWKTFYRFANVFSCKLVAIRLF